jgi:hypothetical protein
MKSLEQFAKWLSSTERDNLQFAAQDMTQGPSCVRLDEVERELKEITDTINSRNKRREALVVERDRLQNTITKLDRFLERQGNGDVSMFLLRTELSNRLEFLVSRIGTIRPTEELTLKHNLSRERRMIEDGQRIGNEILSVLEGSK